MIRIIFAITLLLFTVSGFAAQQDKTLICHVGNEVGPGGEEYDPACVPEEANDYFCADAGKVDLILVAKVDNHLDNPSHEYDGLFDYEPGDVGASAVGTEDSDGNGIDDGCELPQVGSACPCWTSELADITHALTNQGNPTNSPNNWCFGAAPSAGIRVQWDTGPRPDYVLFNSMIAVPSSNYCELYLRRFDATSTLINTSRFSASLTSEENSACVADVQKLQTDFGLCGN